MKIAITGKMCSGKSTIANMIQQLDNEYDTYSYGQKIKDIAVELFKIKSFLEVCYGSFPVLTFHLHIDRVYQQFY